MPLLGRVRIIEFLYYSCSLGAWWRHQIETFSALLAICAENSPVPGEFSTQRPVTRSFDVYFDLRPNKGLSKQLWGWWFETQSCPLWRHRNGINWFFYEWYRQKHLTTACLRQFADDDFSCILMNETFCTLITISLKFVPNGPNNNNSAFV